METAALAKEKKAELVIGGPHANTLAAPNPFNPFNHLMRVPRFSDRVCENRENRACRGKQKIRTRRQHHQAFPPGASDISTGHPTRRPQFSLPPGSKNPLRAYGPFKEGIGGKTVRETRRSWHAAPIKTPARLRNPAGATQIVTLHPVAADASMSLHSNILIPLNQPVFSPSKRPGFPVQIPRFGL